MLVATDARRALQVQAPKALAPLLQPARYKGAHGGRGGAKSWFFADLMIAKASSQPGFRAVCLRETQKSLEQSVKRLLETRIDAHGLADTLHCLNTHIEGPGDGLITFQGLQNHTADSIKSLEGVDVAWVEEAQSVSQRSLTILLPTIRKEGSEIWFSWNPRHETDPVDVLLRGPHRPANALVVETTYADNPWLSTTLREEMERDRRHDPDKYRHVWLGEYESHSEARVFRNWRVAEGEDLLALEHPPHSTPFYFGADWGFAQDPTVMVRCWIDATRRTLYLTHEVYRVGCQIEDTPALFDMIGCEACRPHDDPAKAYACGGVGQGHGQARRWVSVADSARPETIDYMRRHGYGRMLSAKKGAGSVEDGIEFLKSLSIVIHPRCRNAIREFGHYSYKRDRMTEQVMPVLQDGEEHCIDACRYALETVRRHTASTATVKQADTRWQERYY